MENQSGKRPVRSLRSSGTKAGGLLDRVAFLDQGRQEGSCSPAEVVEPGRPDCLASLTGLFRAAQNRSDKDRERMGTGVS